MTHWSKTEYGLAIRCDKATARAEKLRQEAEKYDAKANDLYDQYLALKVTREARESQRATT